LINNKFSFRSFKYPIKDIVVCGMPRSGSTLLFNLIRELMAVELGRSDGFFADESEYKKILLNEKSFFIKKNHEMSWVLINRINSNLSIGFFTYRDIRDVVVSLMQKGWIQDFDQWIDRKYLHRIVNNSLIYADVRNMHLISYEYLMNNKMKVVKDIKKVLNLQNIDEFSIEMIIKSSSIEEVRNKIEKMPKSEEYDRYTHLHKDHIADAEIGKWKYYLSDKQIEVINAISKKYLIKFDYKI